VLLRPEEAARQLRLGRTQVYELMASGELPSIKIGRCRRVPLEGLRGFVQRLIDSQATYTRPCSCRGSEVELASSTIAATTTDNVPEPAADLTASPSCPPD